MKTEELAHRLRSVLGADSVYTDAGDLISFEYDAGFEEHRPDLVVLPRSTAEVQAVVKLAVEAGVPIVPRGAGTGLCSGAVPLEGGIVIAMTRMNRVLDVDIPNRRATVEPGLINLSLSERTTPLGYFYAPDPSSQKISSIGGNVGTNAGGPHCLAYGITTNHVLGLEVVLPDGSVIQTGEQGQDAPGYDLTGLFVGSEGTLGVVTKITVRLTRAPAGVRTALATFSSIDAASSAVAGIIALGMVPAALEIIDRLMCHALEQAFHIGLPPDAGAMLLVEIDGPEVGLAGDIETIGSLCRANGASDVRLATSEEERAALWAARKGAAGAIGRLSPNYYIQDGVVPRTKLPEAMRRVEQIAARFNIRIANVFHAGDGNLHPILLFDRRDADQLERTFRAGDEILRMCVELGGAISGEHGIGFEKREQMQYAFNPRDLAAMAGLRRSFDPQTLFNPGKVLPSGSTCGEIGILEREAAVTAGAAWV